MAVRIRVYPQYGALGGLGYNRLGTNAVSASTYYNSRLQTQRQTATLQLGYERALANERIERARLEERMKNPYLGLGSFGLGGAYGGAMANQLMAAQLLGRNLNTGFPMGGIPLGFGGGAGQTNFTNQTSTGGNQTVTNSNVNTVDHRISQPYQGGWGVPPMMPWGGGGGLFSSLLGALI